MSRNVTNIVIPYRPRPQLAHLHREIERHEENCIVIHRRAGKTVVLINALIKAALMFQGNDFEGAYISPYLKQSKRIAWAYLKKYTATIPNRKISESELSITLPNGARITLWGADNYEAMRGIYLDFCVLDEYGNFPADVYESVLSPALMDRGGTVVFSGTPAGRNQFYYKLMEMKADPEAFTFVLGATESGILTPDQLKKARKRCGNDESKYLREYECSFDSYAGKKIYPEFNSKIHIANFPLIPVDTTHIVIGVDGTGLSPAVVLTYMEVQQFRVFKEFVFHDCDIRDATEAVVTWCNMNLPPRCTYSWYCDPAGKNRDTVKMSSKIYMTLKAREMGMDINLIDGIQNPDIRWSSVRGRLTRTYNGEPAFLIDNCCTNLIDGFSGAYCFTEMVGNPGIFLKKADKKTGFSDSQDALQYICSRLFLTNEAVRAIDIADDYYDEEDMFNQYNYDSRAGRSTIGGY